MGFQMSLKWYRQKAGLTQSELAQRAGLSKGAIGNYESGKRNKISAETMFRLANALNIQPENLGLKIDTNNEVSELLQHLAKTDLQYDEEKMQNLIQAFLSLNNNGQRVAIERIRELTEIGRYKK